MSNGIIIRNRVDTVYVQQDILMDVVIVVVACPFGSIARDQYGGSSAHKCTLCYDRLKMVRTRVAPKACPPIRSIWRSRATQGTCSRAPWYVTWARRKEAQLYGVDDHILDGGLNSFFLLLDQPEVLIYHRILSGPSNNVIPASLGRCSTAVMGLFRDIYFKK